MAGTLDYLGSLSVGACVPSWAAIYAGILAELQAKLAGLLKLQAKLVLTPSSLAGNITIVLRLLAALQAALAFNLPGVNFQLTAVAALILQIQAKLALLLRIQAAMGTAGVHAFKYDGDVQSLGPTIASSGIPGAASRDHCNALVLATTAPEVWVALGKVLVQ